MSDSPRVVDDLPFSQAAENNSGPILEQLRLRLRDVSSVLEVGSGTGQHAVRFASELPHLIWQPSDHPDALPHLLPRIRSVQLDNLCDPLPLDIGMHPWPMDAPDAIYTANTLHIVSTALCEALFQVCKTQAPAGSLLLVYGPFNYDGRFTSPSNESFDAWLKARDAASGIRDFEWVNDLAIAAGYELEADQPMPANNRLLCWRKALP
ncbi:MAG: class I SAM-dependent methyltransferase [Congregibacter sp.]